YYVDAGDNHYLKRVSIDGGSVETIVHAPSEPYDLSRDGNFVVTTEIRELDHEPTLALYSLADAKKTYVNFDSPPLSHFAFLPNGKGILYVSREKGVDNPWTQSLDNQPRKQPPPFTPEPISSWNFSADGTQLAVARGHSDSDAVLLQDVATK